MIVGRNDALLPARVLTPPGRRAATLAVHVVPGGHFVVDECPAQIVTAVLAHLDRSSSPVPTEAGGAHRCASDAPL
jgi:hypothetical protein